MPKTDAADVEDLVLEDIEDLVLFLVLDIEDEVLDVEDMVLDVRHNLGLRFLNFLGYRKLQQQLLLCVTILHFVHVIWHVLYEY